ncbi:hypothetical protein [Streptomyces sp. NBC_00564]|uniref:hypothetical protein n=1 Tax=Streptomyces sp. NBC_00564 TaxID=2903663 RepID=UPI00352E01F8|nr:hypothetical protein OG256_13665 [Streptomyces sp. NBC_00564]
MKDMPADETKDPARPDPARPDPTRSDPTKGSARPAPGEAAPAREAPTGGEDTPAHRAVPVRPAPGTGAREGVGTSADESVSGSAGTVRGSDPDARRGTHGAPSREGAGGSGRDTGDSAVLEGRGDTAVRGRSVTPGTRQVPDHDARLLPQDECDKFELRIRHAVGGFVDEPRDAVAEADQVLEELAARFTDAVSRRRTKLRTSWQEKTGADTEQLRLALRDYREVTERLLRS